MQTSIQSPTVARREGLWGAGFQLAEWRVEPLSGQIEGAEETHHLNPKAMEVLVHLARAPGEVHTKEEILEAVWPETFVTEAVLTSAVWELRKALGDDARRPRFIETIPKRGYRLVVPVAVLAGVVESRIAGESTEETESSSTGRSRSPGSRILGAALVVAVLGAVGLSLRQEAGRPAEVAPAPRGVGLAVLPFDNNTGDPELDWLRQGIPDMLTFDLGRSSYLRVVSLETVAGILRTFETPGLSPAALRRVQQESGAQVVVTGRVLGGDGELRILAQLHDFSTGDQRSEEVEGSASEDVLGLADELSRRIRVGLEVEASELEVAREGLAKTQTRSVEAYESYVEGKLAIERLQFRPAVAHLQRAVELDPEFAHAHEALANAYDILGQKPLAREAIARAVATLGRLPRPEQLLILRRQAQLDDDTAGELELLEQLVALRPLDASLRARLAWFQLVHRRDCEQSIVNYREAIALETPPPPYFYAYLAEAHLCCSDPAAAREALEDYGRRMPGDVTTHHHRGQLFLLIGDYGSAASELEAAIETQPSFPYSYGLLAEVRAAQGRYADAAALLQDALNRAAGPSDREDALLGLARLSLDRGDLEAGEGFAERALEIRPDSVPALELLGLTAVGRGRLDAAESAAERLHEILARNESHHQAESLHSLRAALHLAHGRAGQAVSELEAALALRPMDPTPFRLALARAQVAADDLEGAERSLERLFEINPGFAPARCAFGELLDRLGRPVEARGELQTCLEIWEGGDDAPDWIQRAEGRLEAVREL